MQVVHIPELESPHSLPTLTNVALRDHDYCSHMVHPLTHTVDRYVVGDRFHDGGKVTGHKKPTCRFHYMRLFPELTQFQSVQSEVINAKIKMVRLQSSSQQNVQHYFFYNRLMDHWHNAEIVQKQFYQMQSKVQPGEVVVRDSLYRFVYTSR